MSVSIARAGDEKPRFQPDLPNCQTECEVFTWRMAWCWAAVLSFVALAGLSGCRPTQQSSQADPTRPGTTEKQRIESEKQPVEPEKRLPTHQLFAELAEQPGWRKKNTGGLFFEGPETEYLPGITYQEIFLLNQSKQHKSGLTGSHILKLEIGEDAPRDAKIAQVIPKNLAQNVNELRFRFIATDVSTDFAGLETGAVRSYSIDELVELGCAQVIDEDPFVFWAPVGALQVAEMIGLGGLVFIIADTDSVDLIDKGSLLPVYSRMNRSIKMTDSERLAWIKERLDQYCQTIHTSAKRNNIPPRLLAAVILNELADYEWKDQYQEFVYSGRGRSHGEVQLSVKRILEHGLIDIAKTPDSPIRVPGVDISYDEYWKRQLYPNVVFERYLCERIQYFESGIELAAREIAYLLGILKAGSANCYNPWPSSLLKDPDLGVDLNNIYDNLKTDPIADEPFDAQRERERTLALLVTSAYNGSGAIYGVTEAASIFITDDNPWVIQYRGPKKPEGIQQAVTHGCNSMEWAEFLYKHKDQVCPITTLQYRLKHVFYAHRDPQTPSRTVHAEHRGPQPWSLKLDQKSGASYWAAEFGLEYPQQMEFGHSIEFLSKHRPNKTFVFGLENDFVIEMQARLKLMDTNVLKERIRKNNSNPTTPSDLEAEFKIERLPYGLNELDRKGRLTTDSQGSRQTKWSEFTGEDLTTMLRSQGFPDPPSLNGYRHHLIVKERFQYSLKETEHTLKQTHTIPAISGFFQTNGSFEDLNGRTVKGSGRDDEFIQVNFSLTTFPTEFGAGRFSTKVTLVYQKFQ